MGTPSTNPDPGIQVYLAAARELLTEIHVLAEHYLHHPPAGTHVPYMQITHTLGEPDTSRDHLPAIWLYTKAYTNPRRMPPAIYATISLEGLTPCALTVHAYQPRTLRTRHHASTTTLTAVYPVTPDHHDTPGYLTHTAATIYNQMLTSAHTLR